LGKKYEKVKRKEKKKKKKINGEKFNKQDYFSPYLHRGHQFDHVSRGVQERRVEDSIKPPHFFSITLMSDCLYFFPIYLHDVTARNYQNGA
jgi:hypothetical protein